MHVHVRLIQEIELHQTQSVVAPCLSRIPNSPDRSLSMISSFSDYACEVLEAWKKEQGSEIPFLYPSLICPDRPISTVKTAWKSTLKRAGVPHFPLYTLRYVFCTRLSELAADAVIQRAMRHTSPETKRRYQLGMAEQVRQAMEKANQSAYGKGKRTTFLLRSESNAAEGKEALVVSN